MATQKLKNVFQPGYIGKVKIKNRLIHMGSQGNIHQEDKGDLPVSPRWVKYYTDLAKGGLGMISVGGGLTKLDAEGKNGWAVVLDQWSLEGLKILADIIHSEGAAAFWQIMLAYPEKLGRDSLSLGSTTFTQEEMNKLIPFYKATTALTKEQINTLIDTFAASAVKLQEAGYDGVEINGGHCHGLNTFLSPAWNKRTDEYGGSPENRARFFAEIIKEIKARCGEDFAVIANFSGCEFLLEDGQTVEDACTIAQVLEAAGADLIHCRYEVYLPAVEQYDIVMAAHEFPDICLWPGYYDKDLTEYGINNDFGKGVAGFSNAAKAMKQAVNIPVSVAGRMDAFSADKLIGEGSLDFAAICRRVIADHDYCKKMEAGDYEDVRPCVGCFTCYDTSERGLNSWCMVNPTLLMPEDYQEIKEAEVKKTVLIVGSGAAGLEAARVAALRGHKVILCEKEKQLGGTLPLAGMMNDFHEDFLGFSKWQVRQVEKLGVDIRTKTEVTPALVKKINPDVIICANGAAETIPDIPGLNKKLVMTGEDLHEKLKLATKFFDVESLGKLSNLYLPLGKKVILIGGAAQGLQTAHFLMNRGREVIIVEESDEIGTGMLDCQMKPNLIRWLAEKNTEIYISAKIKEIVDDGLIIETAEGEEKHLVADNVVTTLPMQPNMGLYEQLKDLAPEVYAVGDCNPYYPDEEYPELKLTPVKSKRIWPRFTVTAVREAYRIAHEL